MSEQFNMDFSAVTEEVSAPKKSGGKFGINKGFITKLEFNPNGGAGETPGDVIDITVQVQDREYRNRIFPVTKVYYKGQEIEATHDNYAEANMEAWNALKGMVTHLVKATGVTAEQITAALAVVPTSFAEWATKMTSLKPANFASNPVDVFLEYEYEIKGDNTRTFLQLPKNTKGGYFIFPHMEPTGKWNEVTTNGLDYIDDAGKKYGFQHPADASKWCGFQRNTNFMESPKANQIIEGEENVDSPSAIDNTAPAGGGWGA